MQPDSTALGVYAIEVGMLRLLRSSGAITEAEYHGICEVAYKQTGSDLFLL